MRFSLATLLLVVLCLATWMAVFFWRNPWVLKVKSEPRKGMAAKLDTPILTPDGTRECIESQELGHSWSIVDAKTGTTLAGIFDEIDGAAYPIRFDDDNTLVVWHSKFIAKQNVVWDVVFRRRFPEWWWGHFYRPEVWCALVLTALLAWKFEARQKRSVAAHI